ncbi:hypothetical protein [Qipengyuania sp. MTN3-11]|uniref:hypothetical protein n=1 Tax=Qipengyuania sp. MTN3-11 TaxID=3056557 RepID=UPI0036F316A3
MTEEELDKLAAGLTEAQRVYLDHCGVAKTPYEPRHGRAANWAIRHGYAKMRWAVAGIEMGWNDVQRSGAIEAARPLGCRLTPLGQQLRHHLERKQG